MLPGGLRRWAGGRLSPATEGSCREWAPFGPESGWSSAAEAQGDLLAPSGECVVQWMPWSPSRGEARASAVLGTSSPCRGSRSRAHSLQRLPQEQTSGAGAQQTASSCGLWFLSQQEGPGLCASQVPRLILTGRQTRETTVEEGGRGRFRADRTPLGPYIAWAESPSHPECGEGESLLARGLARAWRFWELNEVLEQTRLVWSDPHSLGDLFSST